MINSFRWLGVFILFVLGTTICAEGPVTAIAMVPGGKQVVLGSQRGIEIRTWPELTNVDALPTKLVHVHDLQFSPDGQQLLAAGGSPAESGEVEVWSWPNRMRLRTLAEHTDVVYRVSWSPDGTRWASCGGDTLCFVYTSETSQKQSQYEGHSRPVLAIRWLDARTLATAGLDQTVRLWDGDKGTHLRTLDNHVGGVNDLAVRPRITDQNTDPKQDVIATVAEDRTVRLWQPRTGRLMRFARLESAPRCVIWSADAKQLLVGCNDGRVRILSWENMETVAEAEGGVGRVYELALDPITAHLLVAGEKRAIALKP